jgi:mono/diheme cytochrome c family protein
MRRVAVDPQPAWSAVLAAATAVCLWAQPGRTDRQKGEPAAADRGRRIYLQHCINCHGSLAQGTDQGPDLVRSVTVLHDTLGSEIGPALKTLPNHKADLAQAEIADLSHFLKQRIEYVIQNRNPQQPPNVLTGNPDAGRAYFNGAGKCAGCHSPAGDLAGIGRRYDPMTIQQRFLFPRPRPVQVTVTPPGGPPVSGTLDRIDDFAVSLRDASGEHRAWKRVAGLRVDLRDPLQTHHVLLDQYTDADMHNVVAYLETLK